MSKIKKYTAANLTEAYLIQGLLEQESISVTILGENLTIAVGGLPADVYHVDLLIEESQYTKALNIILEYENKLKSSLEILDNWKCDNCDNLNPNSFEICWNCQSSI